MTIAVVAEKPAVARDLAKVLGANERGDGLLEGAGYVVTWAIGHLVTLAQPHQIDPAWKRWQMELLPMLPTSWPLEVVPETRRQFEIVKKILRARDVTRVISATDAGREGELIFRYIYEAAGCIKPVSRLWVSSLTPDAIRDGFDKLRDGRELDGLADAARGRSRADWLVGLNLSRAYSLAFDGEFSVGRVQTPTLAMIVERDLSIRAFVPEDYLEVHGKFYPEGRAADATYDGVRFTTGRDGKEKTRRLAADGQEAARIVERVKQGRARIASVESRTHRIPPPLLYDLTELQRHANRLFGLSAHTTLEIAQQLYEQKKLISYPRTDSRHLSTSVGQTIASVVSAIEGAYRGLVAPGTASTPLGRRFVDDGKVSDHHAIIPTTIRADGSLSANQRRIYDLICRRLLQAWHDDHVYASTRVITEVIERTGTLGQEPALDRFESNGTAVEQVGWKQLDLGGGKKAPKPKRQADDDEDDDRALPSGLSAKMEARVLDARAVPKRTKPPPHLTDATLLTAMETAGKQVDEKEISEAMKDVGLGTPATRAAILETLVRRQYVVRAGKSLEATDKGIALVEAVHADVKSPAMTGEWEAKLARIARGGYDLDAFLRGIETYVREVIGKVRPRAPTPQTSPPAQTSRPTTARAPQTSPPPPPSPAQRRRAESSAETMRAQERGEPEDRGAGSRRETNDRRVLHAPPSPAPSARSDSTHEIMRSAGEGGRGGEVCVGGKTNDLNALLKSALGFDAFRPYQEAVCRAATAGDDVLLVMPTGAGKSLCYQLPGLARGGTTLVVSPLIALMEDQVQKLVERGLAAERIHSGRDRAASRAACVRYLAGELDFLFIAPERLRVPGFPEMLAKRKPVLVAIDEAHCISKWGHDFRPDYRMLGQRLPLLRPSPVIALTATATQQVQDDILEQLGLPGASRFIHGFRRTNLAIELCESNPGARREIVRGLLRDEKRRPAIVYAPTRKGAEELADELAKSFSAAAYHAGMDAGARDRVQREFLRGKRDVVVATIAFGMGIDKADVRTVVHVALPGSLEGYYQEIGRAGRDGLPSRAILLHSFVDRKTHEFFLDRDYPDVAMLKKMFGKLSDVDVTKESLARRVGLDDEIFDKALEKLFVHGGAIVDALGNVRRGEAPRATWERSYLAQRDHRLQELARVSRFTQSHTCRMVDLVRHFGDQQDSGAPCGVCDVCAPGACIARTFSEPTRADQAALSTILRTLATTDGLAVGRLHKDAFPKGDVDRKSFEHLLGGLVREGLVDVREATFEKDDETITYQRASLTPGGRSEIGAPIANVRIERGRAAVKKEKAKKGRKKKWKRGRKPAR